MLVCMAGTPPNPQHYVGFEVEVLVASLALGFQRSWEAITPTSRLM